MELFVLKLVGIICATILSLAIIIVRKDDIGISSIILTIIFEILALSLVFIDLEQIISLINIIKNNIL
ncbi:MAG: hypothetical protein J6K45_07975 [Clostridia bacterium]|nr:hypothetical protein [Clostridia bacterium]